MPSHLQTPSASTTPVREGFRYNPHCSNSKWLEKNLFSPWNVSSLKFVLLHTWRNGGSVLQNWQHLTALNCKLGGFPAYLEGESGLQLYFQLPGLKIQPYEITRKDGNGKRIWVQLSLCVWVHRDQSLLHFKMAQCEPVPPQAIFMQHCVLAALGTLHVHWWLSVTSKHMLTVNLSIVPTYPTPVHITELVWIRRNELLPVEMKCVPATRRHTVHIRLKSTWTKLPEFTYCVHS